ncbi:3-keto-disaccharide hydrolase [Haloferula sargassicola]|uniref:3-keto-alpha-glucoside-1,2-lyase/3-keto-2-hydroxy-glucal hydratase domain-containing protein n=1 Tax=Haloferula sargassicola TaxID=490096 RepID=A0ABP9UPF8_9BACT
MLKTLLLSLCLLGLLPAAEEGFAPLFNGKDLTGWHRVNGDGEYTVENGEIVGTGKHVKSNTFLRTDKTYGDFDFRFEFKFDDLSGNSGMMFRGLQKPGEDGRVHGYQCEHDNGKDRAWTAGLYDEARRGWLVPDKDDAKEAKAFTAQGKKLIKWDDWNEIRIVCKDRHLQIWLNGEERVDFTDEAPEFTPEGFFALQVHAGDSCHVRWRNLRIKEL